MKKNSHWPIDMRQIKSVECEKCGHKSAVAVQTIVKVNVTAKQRTERARELAQEIHRKKKGG